MVCMTYDFKKKPVQLVIRAIEFPDVKELKFSSAFGLMHENTFSLY